jgi:hypothetical protein
MIERNKGRAERGVSEGEGDERGEGVESFYQQPRELNNVK